MILSSPWSIRFIPALLVMFAASFAILLSTPEKAAAQAPGPLVPCGGTAPSNISHSTNRQQAVTIAEECQFQHLILLAKKIMNYILFDFAIPFSAILFAYAGFLYLTAVGDTGKVSKAHTIFRYAAGGLVIALAGWLIVTAILAGLGASVGGQFL